MWVTQSSSAISTILTSTILQIAESFKRFGISDKTRNLLAIKVSKQDAKVYSDQLEWAVQGKAIEFNDANIAAVSDLAEIKKVYKLNSSTKPAGRGEKAESQGLSEDDIREEVEVAVLGLMALRGAT